ncbi:MAG: CPBP family glutamic-type intramembrane protease [Reichenbachiella sp.]
MQNLFSNKYKNKPSIELQQIVEYPNSYVEEAIIAAKEELKNRKNGTSEYNQLKKAIEGSKKLAQEHKSIFNNRPKESSRFIKSFIRLVRKPDTHRIQTTIKNRLLLTLRFYFLGLLFLLIASIPFALVKELFSIADPEQFNPIPEYFKDENDLFLASFLIPIVAGLIEETQFRLVLSKFNKRYFDIFIAMFISYFIVRIFGRYFITYSEFYSNLLLQSTLVYVIFAVPIFFTLQRTKSHSSWYEQNWSTSYKYLFYILPFIFSIAHLPTFNLTVGQLALWPFIILPFLVYAFVFSYIRIRIGFIYAVLIHFTIDLIVMTIKH